MASTKKPRSTYPVPESIVATRAKVDTGDKFFLKIADGPDAGKVYVDPAKAYPRYFGELGVEPGQVDQYWLEVARHLMTEDLAGALGKPLHLVIQRREEYALARFPVGKGADAARADAADHYKRVLQGRALKAL